MTTPPLAKRRKYSHNYLTNVIARVDFTPSIDLDPVKPPELPEELMETFSIAELHVEELQKVEVSAPDQAPGASFSIEKRFSWKCFTPDRGSHLQIAPGNLYICYERYQSFEELQHNFAILLRHFCDAIDDIDIHRFGLRYVNQINLADESNPTDWRDYLSADLLAGFGLADDAKTVSRIFNVIEFMYSDGTQLKFQYGMPNPAYPSVIRRKLFVLDYDAVASGLSLNSKSTLPHLERFHKKVNDSFEQVITDGLRAKMGEQDV